MANTYTQIHIQAVFVVKYRAAMITQDFKPDLCKYITGIVQNQGHKMLAVNGVEDHIHVFFGYRPSGSLSDLMRDIKSDSSEWINANKLTRFKFRWQEGFGAFSYCRSEVATVTNYVRNQEKHHQKVTFREEYLKFLKDFEVEYDERYIFGPLI